MEINFTEEKKCLVVKPTGEIDHHTSVEIREKIDRAFVRLGAKDMVFDFSDVTFMDSSGIGMLIGRYRELCLTGGKVYAVNTDPHLQRIFQVSGLLKIIPCYDTLDDVLIGTGGM